MAELTTSKLIAEHNAHIEVLQSKAKKLPKDDTVIDSILKAVAKANREAIC